MGWYEEADLQRARAEAWDKGYLAAIRDMTPNAPIGGLNPYRHERDGEKRYNVPCCAPWKTCTTDIERIGDAWFRISNGDRYDLPVED